MYNSLGKKFFQISLIVRIRKQLDWIFKKIPFLIPALRFLVINPLFRSRRSFLEILGFGGKVNISSKPTIYFELSGVADSAYSDGIRNASKYFLDNLVHYEKLGYRLILVEGVGENFYVSRYQWDAVKMEFVRKFGSQPRKKWNPSKSDVLIFPTFEYLSTFREKKIIDLKERVRIITFIYDSLPIQSPEYFTKEATDSFFKSFRVAIGLSEIIIVNSEVEQQSIQRILTNQFPAILVYPVLKVVTLKSVPLFKNMYVSNDLQIKRIKDVNFVASIPNVVAISTIEPRKGYDDLISSSELAWANGAQFKLNLIGRLGWVDSKFRKEFDAFLQINSTNVSWLFDATDAELLLELGKADLLIAPSRAEGFGLSIVDAAIRGIPILARKINVNIEIHDDYVLYFGDSTEYSDLKDCLLNLKEVITSAEMKLKNFTEPSYEESFFVLFNSIDLI